MGNHSSNQNRGRDNTCLICWEQVDRHKLIECFSCNIILHHHCEETYRGAKGYCKCPHCQVVGTLMTFHDGNTHLEDAN